MTTFDSYDFFDSISSDSYDCPNGPPPSPSMSRKNSRFVSSKDAHQVSSSCLVDTSLHIMGNTKVKSSHLKRFSCMDDIYDGLSITPRYKRREFLSSLSEEDLVSVQIRAPPCSPMKVEDRSFTNGIDDMNETNDQISGLGDSFDAIYRTHSKSKLNSENSDIMTDLESISVFDEDNIILFPPSTSAKVFPDKYNMNTRRNSIRSMQSNSPTHAGYPSSIEIPTTSRRYDLTVTRPSLPVNIPSPLSILEVDNALDIRSRSSRHSVGQRRGVWTSCAHLSSCLSDTQIGYNTYSSRNMSNSQSSWNF